MREPNEHSKCIFQGPENVQRAVWKVSSTEGGVHDEPPEVALPYLHCLQCPRDGPVHFAAAGKCIRDSPMHSGQSGRLAHPRGGCALKS